MKTNGEGPCSDGQLLERFKNGDQQACALIYDRYASALIDFSSRKLSSLEEARNLVHDLFVNNDILYRSFNEIMESEIEKLPPRTKEIFRLSRQQHLSVREIAGRLSLKNKIIGKLKEAPGWTGGQAPSRSGTQNRKRIPDGQYTGAFH